MESMKASTMISPRRNVALISAALLGSVLVPQHVAAASVTNSPPTETERARIEGVVRDYLLAHPEIIPEAMAKLEERQMTQGIAENRQQLETPYAGAWAGNERGDVTLVMFFDYACVHCRKSLPDVQRLLREDPKLKIVFRELPILGADSLTAARHSLAAAEQGKYLAFHDGLYAAGAPNQSNIDKVKLAARLDIVAATAAIEKPAIQQELNNNFRLARNMGLTGTPGWVVGKQVLKGAVGFDALKAAIAAARTNL